MMLMNTDKTIPQINSFLKLKNKYGEDVYSIDELNNMLIVSPMKPLIDVFDTLILCGTNINSEINMSEIFVNTLIGVIERKLSGDNADGQADIDKFDNKIVFREISDCFEKVYVNHDSYQPPSSNQILNEVGDRVG